MQEEQRHPKGDCPGTNPTSTRPSQNFIKTEQKQADLINKFPAGSVEGGSHS